MRAATAASATRDLGDMDASQGALNLALQRGGINIAGLLFQRLLRAAAGIFGVRFVDVGGMFGVISQDIHLIVEHLHEAAADEERFFRAVAFNMQRADGERRHQGSMARQNAELSLPAGRDHLIRDAVKDGTRLRHDGNVQQGVLGWLGHNLLYRFAAASS